MLLFAALLITLGAIALLMVRHIHNQEVRRRKALVDEVLRSVRPELAKGKSTKEAIRAATQTVLHKKTSRPAPPPPAPPAPPTPSAPSTTKQAMYDKYGRKTPKAK